MWIDLLPLPPDVFPSAGEYNKEEWEFICLRPAKAKAKQMKLWVQFGVSLFVAALQIQCQFDFALNIYYRWFFITTLASICFWKVYSEHVPISCTYSDFKFVFWRFKKRENNIIHLSPIWSVLGRIPQNFVVKKLTQKNHPLSSSQCGDCNARWVALSNPWLRSQLNPDDWPTPS
jgi:hypothetical protein